MRWIWLLILLWGCSNKGTEPEPEPIVEGYYFLTEEQTFSKMGEWRVEIVAIIYLRFVPEEENKGRFFQNIEPIDNVAGGKLRWPVPTRHSFLTYGWYAIDGETIDLEAEYFEAWNFDTRQYTQNEAGRLTMGLPFFVGRRLIVMGSRTYQRTTKEEIEKLIKRN